MARNGNTDVIGLIAIAVGALLVMGGLMFLLATSLMSGDLPRTILIPPIVQIVLGLLGSTGGFCFYRGHSAAKYLLLFVAVGVVLNGVVLVLLMAAAAG